MQRSPRPARAGSPRAGDRRARRRVRRGRAGVPREAPARLCRTRRVTDPQTLARACADAMWAGDHASPGLGMRLEDIGPGRAVMSMVVTEAMVNGHGICHGGFIFTLADSAFAYACNSHGDRAVAQHCAITYLRPGRRGETLRAEAIERVRAGRSGITDVRVTGGDGAVVAELRGNSRLTGGRFFETEGEKA
ncbi:MAG: hydroxyphenylacetyl-CoA thioesterase PaaI [Rhodospirillales bacterium]|nr:hydroxyphenylacetyl-CoA thioesterase PaaI [Rhodospirillales bacterium]